jgi:hypothetical protein
MPLELRTNTPKTPNVGVLHKYGKSSTHHGSQLNEFATTSGFLLACIWATTVSLPITSLPSFLFNCSRSRTSTLKIFCVPHYQNYSSSASLKQSHEPSATPGAVATATISSSPIRILAPVPDWRFGIFELLFTNQYPTGLTHQKKSLGRVVHWPPMSYI